MMVLCYLLLSLFAPRVDFTCYNRCKGVSWSSFLLLFCYTSILYFFLKDREKYFSKQRLQNIKGKSRVVRYVLNSDICIFFCCIYVINIEKYWRIYSVCKYRFVKKIWYFKIDEKFEEK